MSTSKRGYRTAAELTPLYQPKIFEWWDRENALGEPQSTLMHGVLRSPSQ